ncbi:MAG: heavy metal translocating P-type ATPase [Anaerotardibacter sp.]
MEHYAITGMSCAACSSRIEKVVSNLDGVASVSVSLLTNSMVVEGTAQPKDVVEAVKKAGYGASLQEPNTQSSSNASGTKNNAEALVDTETPILIKRLVSSLIFLAALLYLSMGAQMWGWPLPAFLEHNHVALGMSEMLLTIIIMVINQRFFISGFKSLCHGAPNMDTLVSLGTTAAFCYSTFVLFALTDALSAGNTELAMSYMHEFYFESAGTILTLITLGKTLESRSKGKTTNALKGLLELAPQKATLVREDIEVVVPLDQVKVDDVFVVRPGESIPVDGTVLEGISFIDESALTGESIPVEKKKDTTVSAGTINQTGFLTCKATRVGNDTTLNQIIQLVSETAATKAPIAQLADKVSGIFVPTVIGLSIITIIVWLILGEEVGFALARGIAVLVISCPCALGLATPVAIMVGSGLGAKNGILFKTAESLEKTSQTRIVALDKTGTITQGKPQVTDLITCGNTTEKELLSFAYSLEKKSEHPLAQAIVLKAQEENSDSFEVEDFTILPGNGVSVTYQDAQCIAGSFSFIGEKVALTSHVKEQIDALCKQGKTPLLFARETELLGIIAVADSIKEDSVAAIKELKDLGLEVVMLTGDNKTTAQAIGAQVCVDEVIAELLPQDKEQAIQKLQQKGFVLMVGDGINDAPALTRADIGIAIGAGSDIALDAADIVLVKNRLSDIPAAINISKATLRTIKQNLFWAFFYNAIGIPLAAGLFIGITGWKLSPMFAAAAMSLSSFCVVTNALRLNLFKPYGDRNPNKDKNKDSGENGNKNKGGSNNEGKNKSEKTSENNNEKTAENSEQTPLELEQNTTGKSVAMKKTMTIEGMMCPHCEMHTRNALEALEGVTVHKVSHEEGVAEVELDKEISDETLKQAVEEQGYKVLGIQ